VSGGLDFGVDPTLLEGVVARCRSATAKPLIVKLTPNVTDIGAIAKAAARAGADILSLVNTYQGLAIDWRRRRPELGSSSGMGGLSLIVPMPPDLSSAAFSSDIAAVGPVALFGRR